MNKRIDLTEDEFSDLLSAINDPIRQRILMLFHAGIEYNVNDIAGRFDVSRPTISHHLNLMKRAGVLQSRKKGKEVFYSFNKEYVIEKMENLLSVLRDCC
jgi:DNA-binding transcriptional ArsR family regulator